MRTFSTFLTVALVAVAFALAVPRGALAQSSNNNSASTPMVGTTPQVPQPPDSGDVNWKGIGVGAGTVVGNAVYMPLKLAYGILGGIAGGAGYLLTGGNSQVSSTIWRTSLGGDYVLTPKMVAGQEPVHFSGPNQTPPPATSAVPPTNTYASAPAASSSSLSSSSSSLSSSPMPPSTTVTHPIDSGAGPVGGPSAPVSKPVNPATDPSIE